MDEKEVKEFINSVLKIIEGNKDATLDTKKKVIKKEVERRIKYAAPKNNI
jgi:hypothetical protein